MPEAPSHYLTVHVVPNAPRSAVVGRHGNALKIKLHAPAVDNKANGELIRFLAEQLDQPQSTVEIVRGQKSREKTVSFTALSATEAETRLLAATKS